MKAYLNQPQSQTESLENTKKAAKTLQDDPAVSDGAMKAEDLKRIADDPTYSLETRNAAKYLTEHPAQFGDVESADYNGKRDGIISKHGMAAYVFQN